MRLFLLALLFSLSIFHTHADTWTDPSFKEMLDEADVVGVFRVISGGRFKASLIPVRVLRGNVKGAIWLGGFSNKYGPIDIMRQGQEYFLFIKKAESYESRFGSSSNFGNRGVIRESYQAADFVRRQENGYLVPTPTSGEYLIHRNSVGIDIFNICSKIKGIPLEDFELFVKAALQQQLTPNFTSHLIEKIIQGLQDEDPYRAANYLAMLTLAGNKELLPIFKIAVSHRSWEIRLTMTEVLASLTPPGKELLAELVSDSVGVVQGAAVRQLKKVASPSELAPLLLDQLPLADNKGIYPSLMNPVKNNSVSGKTEIIRTLGQLKYEPAIPSLLEVLKTNDDYVFSQAIAALREIGSKKYIPVLQGELAKPNLSYARLHNIARVIQDEKLVECKDALMEFISDHNRNVAPEKTVALSTLQMLDSVDSTVRTFVLRDFKHFFSYYDTLKSNMQEQWIRAYIRTCSEMKLVAARPLVYRALHEWTGLCPARFQTSKDLELKSAREDQFRSSFSKQLGARGYKLNHVIWIPLINPESTDRFMISVALPSNDRTGRERQLIATAMGLSEQDVFVVAKEGWCWLDCQVRFSTRQWSSPIESYFGFAKAVPTSEDLAFLRALQRSRRWEADYFDKELEKTIATVDAVLQAK